MDRIKPQGLANNTRSTERTPETNEEKFLKAFGENEIVSPEEFESKLAELGFQHYKAGTFKAKTAERTIYLYQKPGVIFDNEHTARQAVASMRTLAERGVLFPNTTWGIRERSSGNFQLFAITRELAQQHQGPQEEWRSLPRPLSNELYKRVGIDSADMKTELENPNSFVHFIDPGETAYSQNWGWSSEHNTYYPIDVEVIMLGGTPEMKRSNTAAIEKEPVTKPTIKEI